MYIYLNQLQIKNIKTYLTINGLYMILIII